MTNYAQAQLISGLDTDGVPRVIKVGADGTLATSSDGDSTTIDLGTKIDAATMPTGGVGNLGWLSAIWKLISDRIPALSGGRIPVEVGSLNVTVSNASLEIANDVGNPVPISDAGGSITVDGTFWQSTQPISAASLPLPTGSSTSALQTTGNISLASIDTKTPALGQALAAASTPVVLPATQIAALTPPTSVGISGTLPGFASTPTVNIGAIATIPSSLIAANNSLTNTPSAIKESPGVVVGWNIINLNPITVYVKFYNSTVSDTTVGLSLPAFILAIPGGSSDNPGIFYQNSVFVPQRLFSEAITVVCVTELNATSTSAPITPIYIEVSYQ
jgi:hypothetical protein